MTAPLRLGPGIYTDVSAADYHLDPAMEPSLSSSLAKVLVSGTPRAAWGAHPRLNPKFEAEVNEKFDMGSAIHDTLASGGRILYIVTGFADWRKKEAQEQREEARARGFLPILDHQAEQIGLICKRAREQLDGARIDLGQQEPVLIAQDRGVWLRAMMDSLAPPWINDFKITKINLASDRAVAHHMVTMGYDLRAAFYLRVAELVFPDLAGRLNFRWLFIQEDEPHGLRIIEADATMREMGRRKMEHAIGLWARCMAEKRWPHLEGLPRTVPYPAFLENDWLERETTDGFVQGPMATLKAQEKETLVDG